MPLVNVAFQLLPMDVTEDRYSIVDRAIGKIKNSGIRYRVCPFETVMEGDYDSIMQLIKDIQEDALEHGATSILANLKIQMRKNTDVSISDKMEKYE
jgi:uncharacterized protein YqgV (UPF0045/DUF77 family)